LPVWQKIFEPKFRSAYVSRFYPTKNSDQTPGEQLGSFLSASDLCQKLIGYTIDSSETNFESMARDLNIEMFPQRWAQDFHETQAHEVLGQADGPTFPTKHLHIALL